MSAEFGEGGAGEASVIERLKATRQTLEEIIMFSKEAVELQRGWLVDPKPADDIATIKADIERILADIERYTQSLAEVEAQIRELVLAHSQVQAYQAIYDVINNRKVEEGSYYPRKVSIKALTEIDVLLTQARKNARALGLSVDDDVSEVDHHTVSRCLGVILDGYDKVEQTDQVIYMIAAIEKAMDERKLLIAEQERKRLEEAAKKAQPQQAGTAAIQPGDDDARVRPDDSVLLLDNVSHSPSASASNNETSPTIPWGKISLGLAVVGLTLGLVALLANPVGAIIIGGVGAGLLVGAGASYARKKHNERRHAVELKQRVDEPLEGEGRVVMPGPGVAAIYDPSAQYDPSVTHDGTPPAVVTSGALENEMWDMVEGDELAEGGARREPARGGPGSDKSSGLR